MHLWWHRNVQPSFSHAFMDLRDVQRNFRLKDRRGKLVNAKHLPDTVHIACDHIWDTLEEQGPSPLPWLFACTGHCIKGDLIISQQCRGTLKPTGSGGFEFLKTVPQNETPSPGCVGAIDTSFQRGARHWSNIGLSQKRSTNCCTKCCWSSPAPGFFWRVETETLF